MPVSAGIYNALNQPVRSVADYAADYDQADLRKQGIARNALMLQQGQAEMADRQRAQREGETLRNALAALGAGATPEARINAMEGTGLPQGFSQADALRKTLIEQQKGQATIAKDTAETEAKRYALTRQKLEHGVQWLQVAQTPQQAAQMFNDGVQKGYWGMQDAQQQAQGIPQDPAQFQQWKQTQLAQILDAAKLLPNVQTRNTGGSTDTLAINPLTGVPTVTGSVRNTQTPESVARIAEDRRQFGITEKRQQDKLDLERGAAVADLGGPNQVPLVKRFGKPSPGYRWKENGDQEAIPGGPADIKAGELGARREKSKLAAIDQADRIISTVDSALAKVGYSTSGVGSLTAAVPGTTGRDLRTELETVKANLGFAELQAMRDASPTGGALGAIAVQELTALQSTIASLDQAQSPGQLEKGLNKVKGHLQKYKEAAGGSSGGASGSFDAQPKPGAVQTATNPKTGEKLQLVNGQWVPAK